VSKPKAPKPEPEGNWGKAPPSAAVWQARQKAAHAHQPGPGLPLSAREEAIASRFATGSAVDEISVEIGLSIDTVTAYLEQARSKFENAGRPAADRAQLHSCLVDEGLLEP
jgi:DNA-binding NarL/FixJ family response regulator